MEIKLMYVGGAKPLTIEEKGDWIDLRARETVEMSKGEYRNIPLGIKAELPEGFEAHVLPRSSTFKNWGIVMANSMGVVDNSYRGEWQFPAIALRDTVIYPGERICQFRIVENQPEVRFEVVEELGSTVRGEDGFGSTGVM